MQLIQCNPSAAKDILLTDKDASLLPANRNSYELWRIQLDDAIAVGYQRGVLPQGKNPQHIFDVIKHLATNQLSF